jgi:hypothetical protein
LPAELFGNAIRTMAPRLGKALHRGRPADRAYAAAISATEKWLALAK